MAEVHYAQVGADITDTDYVHRYENIEFLNGFRVEYNKDGTIFVVCWEARAEDPLEIEPYVLVQFDSCMKTVGSPPIRMRIITK